MTAVRPGLLVLSLCGCSLLGLYETPPAELPADVSEACARMADVACDQLRGCCTWSAGEAGTCSDLVTAGCVDEYAGPVADGRIVADRASWQSCLDEIAGGFGGCAQEELPEDGSCAGYWVGQLRANQQCEQDSECAPGLECFSTCLDPSSLPVTGEPCRQEACEDEPCKLICAVGHFCDAGSVCRPFAARDERCEILTEDLDDCGENLTCGDDLVCVPDLPDGEECTVSRQCRSYNCEDGACVGSRTRDWCGLDF